MTLHVIFNDDAITTDFIKPESVDLIVTSPPYNLEKDYGDRHDDSLPYADYLHFTYDWLDQAAYWLKPDGRLCVNMCLDSNKFGQRPLYADTVTAAQRCGLKYKTTIIWNENNISRRTAWGSWLSASAPNVISPVETILVMYKDRWKKDIKGTNDIERDEFIQWTNGLWSFPGQSKKGAGGHPAPFPVELPKRCIKLFSYKENIVLDPFMGSGSTLIAAKQLGRVSVGIDISEDYCDMAKRRIEKEAPDEVA